MSQLSEAERLELCLERDRILSSPQFSRSPVMAKLLRYLVDQRLEDTDHTLTSQIVAVEGLGRRNDFDSLSDSYPRVQIGRLRKLLKEFYASNESELQLTIPRGAYSAVVKKRRDKAIGVRSVSFTAHSDGNEDYLIGKADDGSSGVETISQSSMNSQSEAKYDAKTRPWQKLTAGAVLASVFAVVVAFLLYTATKERTPEFAQAPVLTIEKIQINASERNLVQSINNFWGDAFHRFGTLKLMLEGGESSASGDQRYRLDTVLLKSSAGYDMSVQLHSPENELIWSKMLSSAAELEDMQRHLEQVVAEIAPLDGVIAKNYLRKNPDDYTPGYPCLVQYQNYIRQRDPSKLQSVDSCLKKSIALAPDPAMYLAAASFVSFAVNRPEDIEGNKNPGVKMARQAIRANADNAMAVFSGARSAFLTGDCLRGKVLAKKAIALNPYDPDIKGFTGVYLFGCNDILAEQYLVRAIAMRPDNNTAFPAALAFHLVRENRPDEALAITDNIVAVPGPGEPQYKLVQILALAKRGDTARAKRLWKELANMNELPSNAAPQAVLEQFIISQSLISEAVTILRQEKILA